MTDLFAEHQRGFAGAQLLFNPSPMVVLLQQFSVEARRLQRNRRLSTQRFNNVGVLSRERIGHQAILQIEHPNHIGLPEHRNT